MKIGSWLRQARPPRNAFSSKRKVTAVERPMPKRSSPCRMASSSDVGWPSHERLTAHGARIVREETPRAVEIGGRTFGEGMLQGIIDELQDERCE